MKSIKRMIDSIADWCLDHEGVVLSTAIVGAVALLLVLALPTISESLNAEREIVEGTVISCKKNEYHENAYFNGKKVYQMVSGNPSGYVMNDVMAKSTGWWDYLVEVKVDGQTIEVIKDHQYEVGEKVEIEIVTYEDGEVDYN